jgi:hypothetical protein
MIKIIVKNICLPSKIIFTLLILSCFDSFSQNYYDNDTSLSYAKRIIGNANFNSKGIKINFDKIDSTDSTLSFDVKFHLNKKANYELLKEIKSNDSIINIKIENKKWMKLEFKNVIIKPNKYCLCFISNTIYGNKKKLSDTSSEINKVIIYLLNNTIKIYISTNNDNMWYFYMFQKKLLGIISSSEIYNNLIKRKENKRYKEKSYSYGLLTIAFKNDFMRFIKSIKSLPVER